jgi:hypothetical protein
VIGNDVIVAVQAFCDRRYTRVVGVPHVRVAVLTLNLFDPAVNVVAERNGLFRAEACLGPAVENVNKCTAKNHNEKHQSHGYQIIAQSPFSFF